MNIYAKKMNKKPGIWISPSGSRNPVFVHIAQIRTRIFVQYFFYKPLDKSRLA